MPDPVAWITFHYIAFLCNVIRAARPSRHAPTRRRSIDSDPVTCSRPPGPRRTSPPRLPAGFRGALAARRARGARHHAAGRRRPLLAADHVRGGRRPRRPGAGRQAAQPRGRPQQRHHADRRGAPRAADPRPRRRRRHRRGPPTTRPHPDRRTRPRTLATASRSWHRAPPSPRETRSGLRAPSGPCLRVLALGHRLSTHPQGDRDFMLDAPRRAVRSSWGRMATLDHRRVSTRPPSARVAGSPDHAALAGVSVARSRYHRRGSHHVGLRELVVDGLLLVGPQRPQVVEQDVDARRAARRTGTSPSERRRRTGPSQRSTTVPNGIGPGRLPQPHPQPGQSLPGVACRHIRKPTL